MIRLGLGALVSAFAMFMWGFVFWAMGLIDPFTHLSKEGEAAILEAVRAHVPTHGLYMVPEPSNWSEAEIGQKMKDGPYAMLHVSPRGAEMGGQVMALGYLHMLVTSVLLGLLLLITLPAGATWGARFRIALLAGAMGTVFSVLSQPIWWHHAWSASLVFALYDFVSYLIAGAIMAFAVRPD